MLMKSLWAATLATLASISITSAGIITLPMRSYSRPEHKNPISVTKRYLQKRSKTSASHLTNLWDDVMYTVQLGIGTPPQMFNLAIDTGSPITWVLNKTCTGATCGDIFNKFNCAISSTCTPSPSSGILNASYVSGDRVIGSYVNDIYNLGSLNFKALTGVVYHYGADLPEKVDGIIGLWYMLHSYGNVPQGAPFLNSLKDAKSLTEPTLGIWMTDAKPGDSAVPGGEITFGGVDTTRFTGNITYIDCDPISPWTIPVAGFSVGGEFFKTSGSLATIDTGTSAMLVPESVSDAINSAIPGSIKMNSPIYDTFWILPCNGTTSVSFTFGAFTVAIPYSSLAMDVIKIKRITTGEIYCASAAMFPYGAKTTLKAWLLGASLLKNVYSVYDFGTNAETGGRVGFANLRNTNAAPIVVSSHAKINFGKSQIVSSSASVKPLASQSLYSLAVIASVVTLIAS
ncbi:hypothetical protein BGZ76_001701 [Entomortierella beljakovae]|nr:hypothetical protein BGZ76_001701 [Entomortierella beljakovae]